MLFRSKGKGVRKTFINAINAAGDPGAPWVLPSSLVKCRKKIGAVDFDPNEAYSRIFRAAGKLASRFVVQGSQPDYSAVPSEWVIVQFDGEPVWAGVPPSGTLLKDAADDARKSLESTPDDEMCLQQDAMPVFMLWAAIRDDAKAHNFVKTCELIDLLLWGLAMPIYESKQRAGVKRPHHFWQVPPGPSLQVPGHSSWPAGHAFAAGALAVLLAVLNPKRNVNKLLIRAAARIASNRVRGGLHTQLDNQAGFVLGVSVMHALLTKASTAIASTDPLMAKLWELMRQAKHKDWP